MNIIDFNLYKPSDLEAWVTRNYQECGISHPIELTVQTVARIFGVEVNYYEGPCFAEWNDEEGYAFIFLDDRQSPEKQKSDFFHELCHPLRHVGTQDKLPELFQELQETQAAQFQAVAALPVYLLQLVPLERQWTSYVHAIAESFNLPIKLIEHRMRQVIARIDQERRDLAASEQRTPVVTTYSESTHKLLDQLHRQVAERRANYNVGY